MKVHVNYIKFANIMFVSLIWINVANAQTKFKTFEKPWESVIVLKSEYPYSTMELDYHNFKKQGEETWAATKGDWYLKYKKMFDFRCKEPFQGGGTKYIENDYDKSGYLFRLVDNQMIEDSIQFLLAKYLSNNKDTLRKWHLSTDESEPRTEAIIKRLGLSHFKFVLCLFEQEKYLKFIEVPEAEQANDNMVSIYAYKYPADVDILLYDFEEEIWLYIESVTVSGDHELESYVLQEFEPRYLNNCGK